MNIKKKIKNIFNKALMSGHSPHTLALSCALGFYIAFSPFPGAHTIMMLLAQWLLTLNFPLLFLVTSINNPWTMIPFFSFDYAFGYWLVHKIGGFSPPWQISLEKIFESGNICIVSFLVGGNILGISSALLSYPILLMIFKKLLVKHRS
ncbi:DUF2062 domain-containing protein [Candidatus Babeliales bacterium]|nr:DUF2062 domain-containing protein [Candidatus Babeliales bacterium]